MGKIRPKFIKRVAVEVVKRHGDELTTDFEQNRIYLEDVLETPSRTLKNRIAGYVTTLAKQEERAKLS
ncbi:MAG: 30S ribosomal protein S17e [Candidatus Methanofastidiosia archaeon]